jgi:hypothetical protein
MALILSGGNGGNATITGNSGNLTISNAANIISSSANLTATTISSSGNITSSANLIAATISSSGNITSNNVTITTSLAVGATTPSGTAGEIRATNAITAYYSDRRLKANVTPIDNALPKVNQLTGVIYTQNLLAEQFGYHDYQLQVGVLAQDVQEVLPEAVKLAPFDLDENGKSRTGENYLTVQYEKLVPLLIQAIKELDQEVKTLKESLKNGTGSN